MPVKAEDPKRRLAPLLTMAQRRQLQVAMLEDTLQTLIKARMVKNTFVVSSNGQLLEFAQRFGANALPESKDAGVNSAVLLGLDSSSDYERRLVIPADLPLLMAEDVKMGPVLAREGADVVVSPSESFDGTNMLLLTKGASMGLHYDDDSFRKHVSTATALGLKVAVYYSRGVGFDIDRPSDVHRFFKFNKRGSTLTFLGRTMRKAERAKARR
ncbi:MAG: 2-phospho-L-lactate guanylyltransferase [Thaumarchaeota archaeon]|nr:2-phospho-L-lactate guanylyltransferase [Nitrososphaerota archaeon]